MKLKPTHILLCLILLTQVSVGTIQPEARTQQRKFFWVLYCNWRTQAAADIQYASQMGTGWTSGFFEGHAQGLIDAGDDIFPPDPWPFTEVPAIATNIKEHQQ